MDGQVLGRGRARRERTQHGGGGRRRRLCRLRTFWLGADEDARRGGGVDGNRSGGELVQRLRLLGCEQIGEEFVGWQCADHGDV